MKVPSGGAARAVVVGGSIGGLSAGLALRSSGFDVTVHERAGSALTDRGAGIIAHEATLRAVLQRGAAGLDELSIPSRLLRYLDASGSTTHEEPNGYRFTSWQTLHRSLLHCLGPQTCRMGDTFVDFDQDADGVSVRFQDGREERCDLLVCVDGISSTGRRILFPEVAPRYAGYVGWRGTARRDELPPGLFERLAADITYQLLDRGHVLSYPIPSATAPSERSARSVNWVWYRNVAEGPPFDELMTDVGGGHRALSMPPGALRPEAAAELRSAAESTLPGPLGELVCVTAEPFVQVIVDAKVVSMAVGRVCLLGDAAFVARPHAAAGTAKAAEDAWQLGQVLAGHPADLAGALARWDARQTALGSALVDRSAELGDSCQFRGEWRPGDPALLFGLREAGDSCFPAGDPAGAGG
ncbi:MAG: hypothetical protein ACRDYD_10230 [Acidimicrobiales bacterium]